MIFDILFLAFVGLGFYQGWKHGVIYSVFSIVGWFLGIIAALKFSYVAVNFLNGYFHLSPKVMVTISFILILVLVLTLMRLIGWSLEQILKSADMNLPNQVFGGILHSLIGLYVLCVLIWFLNKLDVFPLHQKESSHIYPYIHNLGPWLVEQTGKIIPVFRDTFAKYDDLFGTK